MRFLYSRLHRRFGKRRTPIERRQQIASGLAAIRAFGDAGEKKSARADVSDTSRPHVCIIGAGFAGLSAAYHLNEEDFRVTVLEARGRVGGRVWTKEVGGRTIEAGGELIGYNHPTWLKLAREFKLGFSMLSTDDNYDALKLKSPLILGGRQISERRANRLYNELNRIFKRMGSEAKKAVPDPFRPWDAPNAKRLDAMSVDEWINKRRCTSLAKRALQDQFRNDGGSHSRDQSLLGIFAAIRGGSISKHRVDDYFTQTETLRCAEGNQTLADRMKEAVERRTGCAVTLNCTVESITIHKDGVVIQPVRSKAIKADYVVLAIPPSLWPGQEGAVLTIDPPLSVDLKMNMGSAVKYLSPLKDRFWTQAQLSPSSSSDDFGVTWEGSDNHIAPPGVGPVMNVFAGGEPADAAIKAHHDGGRAQVRAYFDAKIGAVFSDYKSSRTTMSEFISWPTDPFTRAGYCSPAPGQVTTTAEQLSRPFEERLFFAGEHTCPAFYGFMEAALQSGVRTAKLMSELKS
jgi:monoamine oxidase